MRVTHVYRVTLIKQRNCTVTTTQDKITHNEKNERTMKFHLWKSHLTVGNIHNRDHAFLTAWHLMA